MYELNACYVGLFMCLYYKIYDLLAIAGSYMQIYQNTLSAIFCPSKMSKLKNTHHIDTDIREEKKTFLNADLTSTLTFAIP